MTYRAVPRFLAATALSIIAGCANSYQPVVDMRNVDQSRYQGDLVQCREYANQINPAGNAAAGAAIGAGIGAVFGAALYGAMGLDPGEGARVGGVMGVGTGAGGAGGDAMTAQLRIIDNCLIGRGYNVLNRH